MTCGGSGATVSGCPPRQRRHAPGVAASRPAPPCSRLALVWFALVAPTRPDRLTPGAFLRLPVEAVALAAVALVVSGRSARAVAVVVGLLLGVVTLLKVLDLGHLHGARPAVQRGDRPRPARLRVRLRARLPRAVGGVGQRRGRGAPGRRRRALPAAGRRPARPRGVAAPGVEHPGRAGGRGRVGGVRAVRAAGLTRWRRGRRRHRPVRGRTRCEPRRRRTGTRRPSRTPWRRTPSATRPPPTCPHWPARTSCSPSSRATAASRSTGPSRPASEPCWTTARHGCSAWAGRHPVAGSPPRPSVAAAGWPTPRSSPG